MIFLLFLKKKLSLFIFLKTRKNLDIEIRTIKFCRRRICMLPIRKSETVSCAEESSRLPVAESTGESLFFIENAKLGKAEKEEDHHHYHYYHHHHHHYHPTTPPFGTGTMTNFSRICMVKSLEYTKINRNLGNLERVSSSKTANPFGRSTFPRVIVQPRLINSFLRILSRARYAYDWVKEICHYFERVLKGKRRWRKDRKTWQNWKINGAFEKWMQKPCIRWRAKFSSHF